VAHPPGGPRPLYLAALASEGIEAEFRSANGSTIVTADAQGGMVDVHDQRSVMLTAADSAAWLAPDLAAEQTDQLVCSVALNPEAFDWNELERAVENVRSDGPRMAQRIED